MSENETQEPVAVTETAAPDGPDMVPASRSRIRRIGVRLISASPFTVTVLSVFSALVVGAILIVLSNRPVMSEYGYFFAQPSAALSDSWSAIWAAYSNLFEGAVFDPSTVSGAFTGDNSWSEALFPISETLKYTAPLIFTGLAVALAFRGGLFNIGAQGQAIFGAIGAGLIGFELHLPIVLHLIVALIGGAAGGALWGFIPGILKARTGAHEVIVTIMLNNIAMLFLGWMITQKGVQDPSRTDAISKPVHSSAQLPPILGSGLNANLGLIIGLAAVVGVGWLLNRSTFGFELRAVGSNPDASRTAGMSVAWTYTLAMVAAGALAGLGGATVLLGTANQLTAQVVGNIGFDGITVALLGRGKPWGVVWSALLFGGLYAGGNRMQSYTGVTVDLVAVLQAVIVIFIAAPMLIKAIYRLRADKSSTLATNLAKGW
jgi:general nucleoside transport system permease protein